MNRFDLGRFIADVRMEQNLTQQDVVDLTDGEISIATVGRIEAGNEKVGLNKILSVIRVLKIDIDYLSPEEKFLFHIL